MLRFPDTVSILYSIDSTIISLLAAAGEKKRNKFSLIPLEKSFKIGRFD